MRIAPICSSCGSLVIERRTFTDDGVVIVSWPCTCGFVDHMSLSFSEASAARPEAPSGVSSQNSAASGPAAVFLDRLDEERSGALRPLRA